MYTQKRSHETIAAVAHELSVPDFPVWVLEKNQTWDGPKNQKVICKPLFVVYIPLSQFVVRYVYSWYLYMLTHAMFCIQLYEKCNTIVYKIISVFNEVSSVNHWNLRPYRAESRPSKYHEDHFPPTSLPGVGLQVMCGSLPMDQGYTGLLRPSDKHRTTEHDKVGSSPLRRPETVHADPKVMPPRLIRSRLV